MALVPLAVAFATLLSVGVLLPTFGASKQAGRNVRIQLPPRDEAKQVPGLEPFLNQLRLIVAKRDVSAFLAIVASDIVSDPFGTGFATGRVAFRKYWELDNRATEFWADLMDILEQGGAVDGCGPTDDGCAVSYPYWFVRAPDGVDLWEDLVVLGSNVPLYREPQTTAPIVDRLAYDVIRPAGDGRGDTRDGWRRVVIRDGRIGYVREDVLYRYTSLRISLVRRTDNSWLIGNVVAGD